MNRVDIRIEDYTYELPNERIAVYPLEKRDASKLLVYKSGKIEEDNFSNLIHYLPPASTLLMNNTRVIEARIFFRKPSGGVIEIFCLEPHGQSMEVSLQQGGNVEWKCMIGGASKWKPGQVLSKNLVLNGKTVVLEAIYKGKVEDAFLIHFSWQPGDLTFAEILHNAGKMPLPPYIKRTAEITDAERYQTIFAKNEGSVAAPTAALHFTDEVFSSLQQKQISPAYITLNVGAGTFKPVKTTTIAEHTMHSETFTVQKSIIETLLKATKVVAVGTTSLRTLESLHWLGVKLLSGHTGTTWELEQWEAYDLDAAIPYQQSLGAILDWMQQNKKEELHCRTSLLVMPGYRFQLPSALITNFHQPNSTLLLLVAAFIGEDWKKVYRYALDNSFRFLSYGDSSLLWRNK